MIHNFTFLMTSLGTSAQQMGKFVSHIRNLTKSLTCSSRDIANNNSDSETLGFAPD